MSNPLESVLQRQRKKVTTFRSMGLSPLILRGIAKLRYSFPTPIQRRMIPAVLSGRDVFAMSKTGSGKTAGFLIPILQRLGSHNERVGIRALLISPTRELAMQSDQFCRRLASQTDIGICRLVGGDPLASQFGALSKNPDIVIGTPGRIAFVLSETRLSLSAIEYLVLDEADRLFEMGFREQISDIVRRCNSSRQIILVSATLPSTLAGFVRQRLSSAVTLRLDEERVSSDLRMVFLMCKSDEKIGCLLYVLRRLIDSNHQTLIFVSTRHHVELLGLVLGRLGFSCSMIYGRMFADARKLNLRRFRSGENRFMVVTDVAARGIDIPFLDCVVNVNFPSQPKLFVHRVGRAGRAGRSGVAFSIVCPDEMAYFWTLKKFLEAPRSSRSNHDGSVGLQIVPAPVRPVLLEEGGDEHAFGGLPQIILDRNVAEYERMKRVDADVESQAIVCGRAYRKYCTVRRNPSTKAVRGARSLTFGMHPLVVWKEFASHPGNGDEETEVGSSLTDSGAGAGSSSGRRRRKKKRGMEGLDDLMREDEFKKEIRAYRPRETVFEIGDMRGTEADEIMKGRRVERLVSSFRSVGGGDVSASSLNDAHDAPASSASLADIVQELAPTATLPDGQFFVSYRKPNYFVDQQYQIAREEDVGVDDFRTEVFDVTNQERRDIEGTEQVRSKGSSRRIWDKRKGKYVRVHAKAGQTIDATGKVSRGGRIVVRNAGKTYTKWKKATGGRIQTVGELESTRLSNSSRPDASSSSSRSRKVPRGSKRHGVVLSEGQVLKARRQKRKRAAHLKRAMMVRKNPKLRREFHVTAMLNRMSGRKRKRPDLRDLGPPRKRRKQSSSRRNR